MAKPHRWEEISPYLDQAFGLDDEDRSVWLNAICKQDPELGALVRSFLEEHRELEEERFLEHSPRVVPLERAAGPYTLLQKIGQGGMGSVWLAERADGEIQMKVAIKLLGTEGHHPVWRDRFLTERQLLASLNHPSIVRLMDAGHTEHGRPYLVMEFVEGLPIDAYCKGLPVRERLELFVHVCAGVSHAHRRLIIHRDLKPSNILVESSGQPKLLDFGIAKLLDDPVDSTQTAEQLLSPQYASPEQMRGEPQSTATDIYSLGVVLYKMLTGRLPHQSATGTAEAIAALLGTRTIQPATDVEPALPGDIDYILGKALRSEPEERYTSVEAFANDVEALVQSKPVQARSGNAWYRARKFIRRHWIPAAAFALVVAGLSCGLYVANRERAIALHRYRQVRELAHTFVFDMHDELARLGASAKVRELTVRRGVQYLDSLSQNAGDDLELQKEIAAAYLRIGDAQGFPTKPNLGRLQDALESYRKAGGLFEKLAAKDPAYVPDLAQYYLQNASLVRFAHDLPRAKALSEAAIRTFEELRASHRQNPDSEAAYISAWCTLGDIDEDMGHYQLAWNEFSRCGSLAREWRNAGGAQKAMIILAQADERIGTAAYELGLLPEAARAFDEDQLLLDALLDAEPRNSTFRRRRAVLEHYRANLQWSDTNANYGHPALALESAKRYLARAREMVSSDPNDTAAQFSRAIATFQVSYCLREFYPESAITMARESVRLFDEMLASGRKNYLVTSRRIRATIRLGEAELNRGRVQDALRTAEAALAQQRPLAAGNSTESQDHIILVSALILTSQANTAAGNFDRAESLLREAQQEARLIARDQTLISVIPLARVQEAMGKFYARTGKSSQARICLQQFVDLWKPFPPNPYIDRQIASGRRMLASLRS